MSGIAMGLLRVMYEWIKSICLFCVPNSYRLKDVSDETVVITGGGSGIGRLLALKFAQQGSRVVIVDVNENGMKETLAMISKEGKGSCFYYKCDISDREQVYATAQKVKAEVGFVSILVNNAGITGGGKRLTELDDDRIVKTMEVNALAQFWMTKALLPDMITKNRGHVVFVASYAGLLGGCQMADYCASKFAVMGLAESVTLELKADGHDVQTTAICPFLIDTGLFEGCAGNSFIPTLKPEQTADRIMEAIRLNQPILLMPQPLYITIFLKTILPISASFELYKALDGLSFMHGFTGRQNNNNQVSKIRKAV